ncbi:MAG: YafY family protein [Actinomycetota bacterium]|nr:YafY family protein [Actinomycetota bacterium]
MRASRLLSILMLLQARGQVSAVELAEHVEVSVRTVYRDIEQLSAAGVPVYAERGRNGGFRLLDGWRTKLTGLTEEEAQAMFLAGLSGPAEQLGLGDALALAQRKLAAALPAGWQSDAMRVSSRVHLDPIGWYQPPASADHLSIIAAAVWADETVDIRYESWTSTSDRRISPLGLVIKAGTWYVVAETDGSTRTFRLSSVLAARPTGEHFRRPAKFDLAAHWASAILEFERSRYTATATVLVSDSGLDALRRLSTATAAAAAGEPDDTGWRRVTIPIESVPHAAGQLLQLGVEVEVVEPAELRSHLHELAAQIVARHR